jgi:uncharacterized membrane protein
MNDPGKPVDPDKLRRLSQLLEGVAAVARRFLPWVRNMTILALICGIALTIELQRAAHFGTAATLVTLLVLMLPCAVLATLWLLLTDVGDLPFQTRRVYDGLRDVGRGGPTPAAAPDTGGFFRMGGSLREALDLAVDASGITGAIAGVMLLANPLFLLAIVVSVASLLIVALLAVGGGLSYL